MSSPKAGGGAGSGCRDQARRKNAGLLVLSQHLFSLWEGTENSGTEEEGGGEWGRRHQALGTVSCPGVFCVAGQGSQPPPTHLSPLPVVFLLCSDHCNQKEHHLPACLPAASGPLPRKTRDLALPGPSAQDQGSPEKEVLNLP